jgi:23S rRNA pseudouridine2457 synthase
MGVICQFSPSPPHPTLKDFIAIPEVYPAGRLDTDSEGLLLLTDDGRLQARIADPRHQWRKTYWVQVEGEVDDQALRQLRAGVVLKEGPTLPADAQRMAEPAVLWPRVPPIRVRQALPTSWLSLELGEGRNRQVRRMTAAVGLPTLRLIRWAIGPYTLEGLAPGQWQDAKIF